MGGLSCPSSAPVVAAAAFSAGLGLPIGGVLPVLQTVMGMPMVTLMPMLLLMVMPMLMRMRPGGGRKKFLALHQC